MVIALISWLMKCLRMNSHKATSDGSS